VPGPFRFEFRCLLSLDLDLRNLQAKHGSLFAQLDARADELVRRAVDWSNLSSGSTNLPGLASARSAIAETIRGDLGVDVADLALKTSSVVSSKGEEIVREHGPALVARMRPDAPVQIALTGHFDTVYPADTAFKECVLRADGTLHGPGIADMKGGISVMIAALAALEKSDVKEQVGWTILLSPDEEVGSPVSAAHLHELGTRCHVGMTYEPALPDGAMAGPRKGSGNWAVIFRGKSAHVGRAAHEGRNAVIGAARFAVAMTQACAERPSIICNVGAIDGGGPVNVVPDLAIVRINARVDTAADQAFVEATLTRHAETIAKDAELSVTQFGGFTRPPKPETPGLKRYLDAVVEAGEIVGAPTSWRATGGVCEGNNLSAAGCPTVDSLGVRGGLIHSPEEFAIPESFAERARLSLLMMLAFATNTIDARALRAEHARGQG
jgi:glutamate carboxypeptidase